MFYGFVSYANLMVFAENLGIININGTNNPLTTSNNNDDSIGLNSQMLGADFRLKEIRSSVKSLSRFLRAVDMMPQA